MPVLTFELKRQLPSFLLTSATVAALLVALLVGLWPIFHDAQDDVAAILASYPPEFLEAFGAGGDVLSFTGFLTFIALYFELGAAIAGFGWGLATFGRERRDRCSDFLLTMPLSRTHVFAQKLACCLVGVAVLTLASVAAATATAHLSDIDVDAARLALATAGLGGVALVFMAAGSLAGTLAPRVRSVSAWASCAGVVGFVLGVLPELTGENKLKAISPFSWFAPSGAMDNGAFDTGYVAVAALVTVALLVAAYLAYIQSDAHAE